MASQSLYRKWRSQTFTELVGQEAIIQTLKNALSSGKLAHAYLFTGPRGTGKTSTARLLAKTINCTNPQNGEPCNKCQQCREITAGNSFNVIEIDAASNRGIDSIRELRESVMTRPSTGTYKVYVLDEAHMLTTEAFNALLKTLEEPPDYAIFVLATTDVHKLLPTVLSRCQRFDFKRISMRQIVEHLEHVADQEEVTLERSAAELLARAAAGGMRDALSLLDQSIAYSGSQISLVQVQAMLGVADPRAIRLLIEHIARLNSSEGLHLINKLSDDGADLRQINAQLIEYWRSLMLAKAGADLAMILDSTQDEMREIQETASSFTLEELTACARVFAQNELVQKNLGTPQLGLELAFLECLEIHHRAQSGVSVIASPAPMVASKASIQPSVQPPVRQTPPALPVAPPPIAASVTIVEETSVVQARPVLPEREIVEFPATEIAVSLPAAPSHSGIEVEANKEAVAVSAAEENVPGLTLQQILASWERVKKRVRVQREGGSKVAGMLSDYEILGVEGNSQTAIVLLQAKHDFSHKFVHDQDRYRLVERALTSEFNQPCEVRLIPAGQPISNIPKPTLITTKLNSSPEEQISSRTPVYEPEPDLPPRALPPRPKPPKIEEEEEEEDPLAALQPDPPEQNRSRSAPIAQDLVADRRPDLSPTLARKPDLRDNTGTLKSEIALVVKRENLDEKVRQNPVVQEVVRMFSAKIVNVNQK